MRHVTYRATTRAHFYRASRHFDNDDKFLEMWKEAREAAASPPRNPSRSSVVPTTMGPDLNSSPAVDIGNSLYDDVGGDPYVDYVDSSPYDNVIDSDSRYSSSGAGTTNLPFFIPDDADGLEGDDDVDSPELLARHLGVGGHGPLVAERLAFLAKLSSSSSSWQESAQGATSAAPGILPSLYFGDLRAGDGAATAETMELCRERGERGVGVQAFSVRYVGGEGGEEAGKGAAAAADYEHEDVSVAAAAVAVAAVATGGHTKSTHRLAG